MESTEPNDLPVIEPTASPCLHLRSKGMYVYTDPPEGESYEDDDTTNCWCFQTLKSFGPDDELVGALRLPRRFAVLLRTDLTEGDGRANSATGSMRSG